jgi:hypothetical protein
MIGKYLPNNNKTATVAFRQKFCQLKQPLNISPMAHTPAPRHILLLHQIHASFRCKQVSTIVLFLWYGAYNESMSNKYVVKKKCRTSIVSTPYQTHRMTRINHDVAKRTVVTFYKEYEKKKHVNQNFTRESKPFHTKNRQSSLVHKWGHKKIF